MRKIIGLDFKTFQCPLCKHIANVLLPVGTMSDGGVSQLPKQKAYDLLDFELRILSQILKHQDDTSADFLPVDCKKRPE